MISVLLVHSSSDIEGSLEDLRLHQEGQLNTAEHVHVSEDDSQNSPKNNRLKTTLTIIDKETRRPL